jgi:hypothetical protein
MTSLFNKMWQLFIPLGRRLLGVREEAVIKEEDEGAGTIVTMATALSMEKIILGMPASF